MEVYCISGNNITRYTLIEVYCRSGNNTTRYTLIEVRQTDRYFIDRKEKSLQTYLS